MQTAQLIEEIEITDPTPAAFKRLPPVLPAPAPQTRELPSRPTKRHCFAGHYESPDIVNFPFALTVFAFWGAGLITTACGILAGSVGIAVVGSLVTLAAGLLNGWGLSDDCL